MNITIDDHYPDYGRENILINVNESFSTFISVLNDTYAMFIINFTNIPSFFTMNIKINNTFKELGTHSLEVIARNEKNDFIKKYSFKVIKPTFRIENLESLAPKSILTDSYANISYKASSGNNANCSLYMNNQERNFTFRSNLTEKYSLKILFMESRIYNFTIVCINEIGFNRSEWNLTVLDLIYGLNMTNYYLFESNDGKNISWTIVKGFGVRYEIYEGSLLGTTKDKYFVLPSNIKTVGYHSMTIIATNNISLATNTTVHISRHFRI